MRQSEVDYKQDDDVSGANISGATNADLNAAAAQTHMDKFHANQGHGFAAEQANHLYDVLTGNDATIVGGDNAKNGADRLVNGINIQTKYCESAGQSVAAAFESGQYRYINPDGSLMQLEVPSDQYDAAVEAMKRRIESGHVPGVTNPDDAKSIVRKGHFTYKQAKNIAKAGTVESLTFDAVNGAIISTNAFGITATIAFARSLWNGDSPEIAIENAVYEGVQMGGASFAASLISAQLARTGVNQALIAPTNGLVKLLGPKASAEIANALRSGANIYGAAAMNNVAKLLRGNLITATVMTVVLSAKDIGQAFRGRISGKQLFKNISTTAGGMAGGMAGFLAGKFLLNMIAPGSGEIVGFVVALASSTIGGTAGGGAAHAVVGQFIEDDAVALVKIIEAAFCQLAQDYMLTEDEVDIVLGDLSRVLDSEKLLDMFASADHEGYADTLVREQIEKLTRGRCRIYIPAEDELVRGLGKLVEDAATGQGIFSADAGRQPDPVEIGRELTGQELSPHAARKAWYATKQMNLTQVQAEGRLQKIASDEKKFHGKMEQIRKERDGLKNELTELMGGMNL